MKGGVGGASEQKKERAFERSSEKVDFSAGATFLADLSSSPELFPSSYHQLVPPQPLFQPPLFQPPPHQSILRLAERFFIHGRGGGGEEEAVVREGKETTLADLHWKLIETKKNSTKLFSHSQASLGLAVIAVCAVITSAACADEERKPAKSTSARKRSEVIFDIFSFSFVFSKRNSRSCGSEELERVRKECKEETLLSNAKGTERGRRRGRRRSEGEEEGGEEGGGERTRTRREVKE